MARRHTITLETRGRNKLAFSLNQRVGQARQKKIVHVFKTCGYAFNKKRKAWIGPIDNCSRVVDMLTEEGILVESDPDELIRALKKRIKSIRKRSKSIKVPKELYDFQRDGVKHLSQSVKGALFDDMGLGKSAQSIASLPHILAKNKDGKLEKMVAPTIVVCPGSVRHKWAQEFNKWKPEAKVLVCDVSEYASAGVRSFFIPPPPGHVFIYSYRAVDRVSVINELRNVGAFSKNTYLIADEVHKAKNPKAKRTKGLRALRDACLETGGSFWILTGTPIMNRPAECWHVMDTLGVAEEVFGSKEEFCAMFGMNNLSDRNYNSNIGPEVAKALAKVVLRRHKEEVLKELPEKRYQEVIVEKPTPEVAELCDEVLNSTDIQEALRQLSMNERRLHDFTKLAEAMRQLAICKLPHAFEFIESFESAGLPLVVFSSYQSPVLTLGKRDGWLFVTGSKKSKGFKTRNDIVNAFQDPNSEWTDSKGNIHKGYRGIVCTTGSMREGHDLYRAENTIFLNRTWVPGADEQAENRTHRIGATGESVTYIDLIADHPLDRRLFAAIEKKRNLISKTTRKIPVHNLSLDPGIKRKIREHKQLIKALKRMSEEG